MGILMGMALFIFFAIKGYMEYLEEKEGKKDKKDKNNEMRDLARKCDNFFGDF